MKFRTKSKLKKNIYLGEAQISVPPDLAAILDRYRGQPDALITVLEEVQNHYSYLPRNLLEITANELGFPLSQVYGVATFYNLFQLTAPGRYQVRVCNGTACYVGHAEEILEHLKQKLGIDEAESV